MITVNELFSGIGAQIKALKNIGLDARVVGVSEIDKYAIQSYEAIHGKTRNYGDISTVERLDYADLWTYSFPCQDLSVAGKQRGMNENTRSGLLYQVQRLLEVAKEENTLPKYLLLENVKNLVGKQFKAQFDEWLAYLDELGYKNYWQVLNAKDYGIPQNRERVFVVSIRKDIGCGYTFPQKEELGVRLKDVLEENVDEKFYISDEKANSLSIQIKELSNTIRCGGRGSYDRHTWDLIAEENKFITASRGRNPENPSDRTIGAPTEQRLEPNFKGLCNTLTSVQKDNYVVENKVIQVENIVSTGNWDNPQRGRIYSGKGISPTLNCMQGGGLEPKIIVGSTQKHAAVNTDGITPTLTSAMGMGGGHVPMPNYDLRIRKLTPKECWRLMGFDDEDFNRAQTSGVSNSQLYKQAGNSIVVPVLEKIFANLFTKNIWKELEEMDI